MAKGVYGFFLLIVITIKVLFDTVPVGFWDRFVLNGYLCFS